MSTPEQPPQQPPAGYPPAGGYPPPGGYPPAAGYPQGQPGYPYPAQPAAAPPPAPAKAKRPWNVTLVAIIALLGGLIQVITGLAALLARNDLQLQAQTGWSPGSIATFGAINTVIGAIILLLSFGLFGGSRLARGVIAFFCVVHIAVYVVAIVLVQDSNLQIRGGWQIFWSVIVLILLYAGARTKSFFARG